MYVHIIQLRTLLATTWASGWILEMPAAVSLKMVTTYVCTCDVSSWLPTGKTSKLPTAFLLQ